MFVEYLLCSRCLPSSDCLGGPDYLLSLLLFINSLTYLLVLDFIHASCLLIHSFSHLFSPYSFTHLFINSLAHSFLVSFTYSFIYLPALCLLFLLLHLVASLILIYSSLHQYVYSLICISLHLPIPSPILHISSYPSIHP